MSISKYTRYQFSRYEYKFIIPKRIIPFVANQFSKRATLDPFNKNGEPYMVHSLYFDSPSYTFYREKIEGYPGRKKVRLRWYDETITETKQFFIEIKNKKLDKIYKERALIDANLGIDFIRDSATPLTSSFNNKVLGRVMYLAKEHSLQPAVGVKYKRFSLIDNVVPFKVSFDMDITSYMVTDDRYIKEIPLTETHAIMEYKFASRVPLYAMEIVMSNNLMRTSVSKYCHGIDAIKGINYV